jgi:tetratricopeptide (TPR) repeat protein
MAKATAAAHKAMALNPQLAESYEATAHVRMLEDWNWSLAEREFRRAIELNPAYATAHQRLALLLTLMDRLDEAQAEIARARALEPLSLIINADVGLLSYIAGDGPRAIAECLNVLDMAPDFGVAHFVHGLALEGEQRYEEAIAAFHRAKNTTGGITVMMGSLGHAYAVSGRHDEAHMILEEAEEIRERRYVSPYSMATIHLGLGDRERALHYLARACEEKSVWLVHLHLKVDPRLADLRSETQFQDLLKTVGP